MHSKRWQLSTLMVVLTMLVPGLAGCATPTPEVIEKTVTKEVRCATPTPEVIEKIVTKVVDRSAGLEVISRDFSDFTHFAYVQEREGEVFCPNLGIFGADISRRPNGDYLLKISMAERGTAGVDQCLEDASSSLGCVKIIQFPERILSPGEVDAVLEAFRQVEIAVGKPSHWLIDCEQPCLRDYFAWDSYGISHGRCYLPSLYEGQVLMNLLGQLAVQSRESLPTAAPRPHRCITYEVFPTYIRDIEIAPDHTVWIASGMGAARYDPVQNNWIAHTTEQGLPSSRVWTVTIAGDDSVWLTFSDEVGASHYDGERWRTYTVADGLPSNEVHDVAVDADGTVWFATGEGVSRWDRAANTWASYDEEEALAGYEVLHIRIANDGSMWFSGIWNATHLTFDKETGEPVWKTYDEDSAKMVIEDSVAFREMVLAPDGKVCVAVLTEYSYHRIVCLDPETETWFKSSCCQWPVRAFGLTENDGLWAGNDHGVDFMPQPFGGEVDRIDLLYLNTKDGLASKDITCLAVESDRVVWVGTDKGVSRCEIRQ